jgi:hypothetical protein
MINNPPLTETTQVVNSTIVENAYKYLSKNIYPLGIDDNFKGMRINDENVIIASFDLLIHSRQINTVIKACKKFNLEFFISYCRTIDIFIRVKV